MYSELREKAIYAALESGKKLKKYFGTNLMNQSGEIDKEAEKTIMSLLDTPDIGFHGEELGKIRVNHNRFWLVDALDGTSFLLRGLPFCTTMISLIEDGDVAISVIYDFINNQLCHAEKGQGAIIDNQSAKVSDRSIEKSLISFHSLLKNPSEIEALKSIKSYGATQISLPIGYEYLQIASGKIDGLVCLNPRGKIWDYAPGTLIVREAGGLVTNIGKLTYDYSDLNLIASNKRIHQKLIETIFPINQ